MKRSLLLVNFLVPLKKSYKTVYGQAHKHITSRKTCVMYSNLGLSGPVTDRVPSLLITQIIFCVSMTSPRSTTFLQKWQYT